MTMPIGIANFIAGAKAHNGAQMLDRAKSSVREWVGLDPRETVTLGDAALYAGETACGVFPFVGAFWNAFAGGVAAQKTDKKEPLVLGLAGAVANIAGYAAFKMGHPILGGVLLAVSGATLVHGAQYV